MCTCSVFFVNGTDTALSERLASNRTEAIDTWCWPSDEVCQVRDGQILQRNEFVVSNLRRIIGGQFAELYSIALSDISNRRTPAAWQ